ncbi:hypothetical protein [Priestia megaterium]|uniref:hypothetical protein n=1 Tax=Priestia megaterium TaxID=1404 RepID=UPI002795AE92|nr:hypothetical protein [Priestia megaterium]
MAKKARTYRLHEESIGKLELMVAVYQEMQRSDFKTIKLSQADVLEKIISDQYDQLMMQVSKSFVESVKEKMNNDDV